MNCESELCTRDEAGGYTWQKAGAQGIGDVSGPFW